MKICHSLLRDCSVVLNTYVLYVSNVTKSLQRKKEMRVELDKYWFFNEFEIDMAVMAMKNIIQNQKDEGQFRDRKLEEAAKTILEYFSDD
jgi:hypothetical protein